MTEKSYFLKSFAWSTISRILSALLNFVTVPLLLGFYGQAGYGLIAIAVSCNSYMHLLDLGMNNGAIKFYAQWKAKGLHQKVYNVARTNITFYLIISFLNILGLLALAIWGEPLFSITHDQFLTLRTCFYIISLFAVLSWITTVFNQLLVADRQISYTMQWQSVVTLIKGAIVGAAIFFKLSIDFYFFLITLSVAILIVPYSYKCKRDKLIDKLTPAHHWQAFKEVFFFSLSLFALGFFQMTSTQSRPLLLSIFAQNGADTVAQFRIIEVFPQLVIMIGGVLTSIFLPKTSEIVATKDKEAEKKFAYKWTILTTILANILCFPFIIGAVDILSAYVGSQFAALSPWLILWTATVLLQIHSTPSSAIILAHGKTKALVIWTSIACIISMIFNAYMAKFMGVGSAVSGYCIYILILFSYYYYYYKEYLFFSLKKIFMSFGIPTFWGVIAFWTIYLFRDFFNIHWIDNQRFNYLLIFILKALAWLIIFSLLLFTTKTLRYENKRLLTPYDITGD